MTTVDLTPGPEVRCKNCGNAIVRQPRTSTGWTHGDAQGSGIFRWSGVRCPGRLTGAEPRMDFVRCPGCQTGVTAAEYHVGRQVEGGPIRNELILEPCGHRFENADADRVYVRIKEAFEAAYRVPTEPTSQPDAR